MCFCKAISYCNISRENLTCIVTHINWLDDFHSTLTVVLILIVCRSHVVFSPSVWMNTAVAAAYSFTQHLRFTVRQLRHLMQARVHLISTRSCCSKEVWACQRESPDSHFVRCSPGLSVRTGAVLFTLLICCLVGMCFIFWALFLFDSDLKHWNSYVLWIKWTRQKISSISLCRGSLYIKKDHWLITKSCINCDYWKYHIGIHILIN